MEFEYANIAISLSMDMCVFILCASYHIAMIRADYSIESS